jgi:hypothetical protein
MFRCGDEVGKRVPLLREPAAIVPESAKLFAAADVRDGDGEAAVEQADGGGGEGWVVTHAIGAVAVEQQRPVAVWLERHTVDE